MSEDSIMIVAKFIATPGKAEALQRVLEFGVLASREESGCLHYDLYRSLDDQNVFLIHERWRDQAALEHHQQQPHFIALMKDAEPLLSQQPDVTVI